MIGKIIGALAGAQATKYSRTLGGPGGAALGFLAVPILRRIRLPALLAIVGGGYVAKKLIDKDQQDAARTMDRPVS